MEYIAQDFFKARRQQILSCYTNADQILSKSDEADVEKSEDVSDDDLVFEQVSETNDVEKSEDNQENEFEDAEEDDAIAKSFENLMSPILEK